MFPEKRWKLAGRYVILVSMEKTILIAGKELPEGKSFAEAVSSASRNTVITSVFSGHTEKTVISGSLISFEWNRSSAVAAHSLVLHCENEYGRLNEAVLYFDEPYYEHLFTGFSVPVCDKVSSEIIAGYQYLTLDLLSRFEAENVSAEKKPADLVFLYKTEGRSSSGENAGNPPLKAAGAAFSAFAESVALSCGNRPSVNIILVHADASAEAFSSDQALAAWLCAYLDTVDNLKEKLNTRQSGIWVKPGSKGPGSFTLFH